MLFNQFCKTDRNFIQSKKHNIIFYTSCNCTMRITLQDKTDTDTDSTKLVRNQLYVHMKKMRSISIRYHIMVISLLQQIVSINKSYTHLFVSSWVYIQNKFVLLYPCLFSEKLYRKLNKLCNYAMCKK